MKFLQPGLVRINVAEFLAAHITSETFNTFCLRKFTRLAIDNRAAVAWMNAARCPVHPFDRCALGVNLLWLEGSQKLRAEWIPLSMNNLGDQFSRHHFSRRKAGHVVADTRMLRVSPKWKSLLKFYKR